VSENWHIQEHLAGFIDHGEEQTVFVGVKTLKHNSSLGVAHIHTALARHAVTNGGRLPPYLDCHMDNADKNSIYIGYIFISFQFCLIYPHRRYFCLLVEYDVVKVVNLNFLPVGHTHEDIDRSVLCIFLNEFIFMNASLLVLDSSRRLVALSIITTYFAWMISLTYYGALIQTAQEKRM
jgi:hypothetical protein